MSHKICKKCSKKSIEHEYTGSVGVIIEATGFQFVMTEANENLWYCPECYKELYNLCDKMSRFGSEYFGISFILYNKPEF